MDLATSMLISAAGMRAESQRMRVVTENIANANTTPLAPGQEPYRRKLVVFRNVLDRELGVQVVKADKVILDRSGFSKRYDPQHPAADADGYVLTPNVNPLIEMMDMRQALRSYEANLSAIENARTMLMRTVDLLRN